MINKLDTTTGKWTPANLRLDFPNTSFPSDLSQAVLPDGYAWCKPTAPPACGPYENLHQLDPEMVDGVLLQRWEARPWALADIASAKLARIREARKAMERGGIALDGVRFESDPTARAKYIEVMLTMHAVPELTMPGWKAGDDPVTGLGVYVTMTQAVLADLWAAGQALDAAAFAWEQARQAEIAAALAAEDFAALAAVAETMEEN